MHNILTKLNLRDAGDDHRLGALAVITFLEAQCIRRRSLYFPARVLDHLDDCGVARVG